MAEEEVAEIEEEEEAPKKSRMRWVLIGTVVLALLGAGGYFAYLNFFAPPAPKQAGKQAPATGAPATKKPEAPVLGVMVPLKPFVVNLAGTKGKRFLKVAITLELSSPEVNAEINENLQKIADSILILLSSKTFEEVYSVQGKFKLKDEITTRVNRFLVLGHVKDAYFTEFVIQ
ncbi:MAG: flagellar basal body-associated FliL family protein [Nitrospinales bacterium]